jgi:hypothetical protein
MPLPRVRRPIVGEPIDKNVTQSIVNSPPPLIAFNPNKHIDLVDEINNVLSAFESAINALNPVVLSDFALSLSASNLNVTKGGSSGTITASFARDVSFTSALSVSVTGLPSGVTVSPASPANVPNGTNALALSITADATATVASSTITVTAVGGGQTHSLTFTLAVLAAAAGGTINSFMRQLIGYNVNSTLTDIAASNFNLVTFGVFDGNLTAANITAIKNTGKKVYPYIDISAQETYTSVYGAIPGATFWLDVTLQATKDYIQRKIDYWVARGVNGFYLDDPFPFQEEANQIKYATFLNWVLDRLDVAGVGCILNMPGHALGYDRSTTATWNAGGYWIFGAPVADSSNGRLGWVKRCANRSNQTFFQIEGLHFHGTPAFGDANEGLNVNFSGNPAFSASYSGGRYATELYWAQAVQSLMDKVGQRGIFVLEYMPASRYSDANLLTTWNADLAFHFVPAIDPGSAVGRWFAGTP